MSINGEKLQGRGRDPALARPGVSHGRSLTEQLEYGRLLQHEHPSIAPGLPDMEREYIRDRTLEGHESARKRGKILGGAGVTDNVLSMALHLRGQDMSLRDLDNRLVMTIGKSSYGYDGPIGGNVNPEAEAAFARYPDALGDYSL
ncbi:hypothetical protein ACIBP6_03900 [Nonomuraea terrae]|uniref:hypothetical protein n=1 Tax=Nonomuraea terrae TaxID=2530383 RepID=UPI0037BC9422